jgi:hypothetical protein
MNAQTPEPPVDSSLLKPLLVGGLIIAIAGFLIDVGRLPFGNSQSSTLYQDCQGDIQNEIVLSREQLAQVLTIPERDARERVQEILAEPYCRLPNIEIRAGVAAEREAYPLAFDPQTWLVILYEGDEYAGFRFSFQ